MLKNKLIKNLEKVLKEKYYIFVQKIYKSEESTVGNVYIIETKEDKYILKIYNDLQHVKAMVNLYKFLNDNNFYTPIIINNNENLFYTELLNEKFIVIYSYLEGIQIKQIINNFTSENIKQLASYLRKFHEITYNDNKFELKLSPININEKASRYSALHFDLTTGNIFYNEKNNKIGLIDFDDAKFGPSIIDVAILIGNLFISKKRGIELNKIKIFLDEYYKDKLILKKKELPFIKECIIKWINHITTENQFNSSTKDSFRVRKELVLKVDFINL